MPSMLAAAHTAGSFLACAAASRATSSSAARRRSSTSSCSRAMLWERSCARLRIIAVHSGAHVARVKAVIRASISPFSIITFDSGRLPSFDGDATVAARCSPRAVWEPR